MSNTIVLICILLFFYIFFTTDTRLFVCRSAIQLFWTNGDVCSRVFKSRLDPLIGMFCHLCSMDSSDSALDDAY